MQKKGLFNSKGVFFTFLAFMLSIIIILSFTVEKEYRLKDKMSVVEIRINTLNNFFIDVEKDLTRGLYISGFRSFLAMEEYISNNGVYLDDVNVRFREAILNGTVNIIPITILQNQTFKDWTKKINDKAMKIDIKSNISIVNLTLYHIDQWNLGVLAYVNITIVDNRKTASFSKISNISTTISIIGFEDPFYTINSFGRVFNVILKTDVLDFNDINQLKRHLNYSFYKESITSPDFLMRMNGNYSNSTFGIESLVNVNDFTLQGLIPNIKSNVDYLYLGNQSPIICLVNQTIEDPAFSWFRLDDGHLGNYSAVCKP